VLNKAQIIGRMGRDPETRYLPSGEAVCNFSLATTEKWKDKATGEQKEATEWHRVSAFGRLAEIVGQYLRQGSLVYVEGKLTTRKYTDKNGEERSSTEIRLSDMKMLSSRDSAPSSDHGDNAPAQPPTAARARPERRPAPPTGTAFDGG
jgi:single-strand DNA-binding protein